jgi:uncharacterized delta-60 repeat protein
MLSFCLMSCASLESLLRARVLFAALAVFVCFPTMSAAQTLDAFDPNANGIVYAVAVQPDGKILVGGAFTTVAPMGGAPVTRNRIARFHADGSLDALFNPNVGTGTVYAIAVQADGKILIGGQFTNVGSAARSNIARVDAVNGAPDSLSLSPNTLVKVIAKQPSDGKFLIGGGFTTIGGQTRNKVARFDPSTGLIDSFNPNMSGGSPTVFTFQPDGKILIGGQFTSIGGVARSNIARIDAVTGVPDSFNPNVFSVTGAGVVVYSIELQADGKILIGGQFSAVGAQTRNNMARVEAVSGTADSFNPNVDSSVHTIAVLPDGRILIGGLFSNVGGQPRGKLARLDPSTGAVDSFNPNVSGTVFTIVRQPSDGKFLIGGVFTSVGGVTRNRVARLTVSSATTLSGKVYNAGGAPVAQAGVTLTDLQGKTRVVYTDTSGTFNFTDVTPDAMYIVGVYDTRYRFTPQLITYTAGMADLVFKAAP